MELPVKMRRNLRMNRKSVRARAGKIIEIFLRLNHHEVDIDRQRRESTHRFDHFRPERQVRDEAAVHHVDVNEIGTAGLAAGDFVREPSEVRAENGRSDTSFLADHGAIVREMRVPGRSRLPAAGVCETTVLGPALESDSTTT